MILSGYAICLGLPTLLYAALTLRTRKLAREAAEKYAIQQRLDRVIGGY